MSAPNLSCSLWSLDELPNKNTHEDRFIKSRTTLEDVETAYKISPYRKTSLSPAQPNDENHVYGHILKINLRQKQGSRHHTVSNFSMFEDALRIPYTNKTKERVIGKQPFKVLDAPNLLDDFYVNVIDWSIQNNVAVGLGNSAYLWNFYSGGVDKVFESDPSNVLTSLCWDIRSEALVLGALNGRIEILDIEKKVHIRQFHDHCERVGALSLHGNMLVTGSRDQSICLRDLRCEGRPIRSYTHHYQEVCGLKWSPDGQYFASGGNDNYLYIFSPK